MQVTFNETISFPDYKSGFRLQDGYKLVINWKNDNNITICRHDVIVKFFWRFIFLVKFSYWSNFQVNIITCSGVMIILFYKVFIRNLEIGNTPLWVFPNIWKLWQVRDIKIGTNVSNEMLLHAGKCQGYSFYRSWVIKGKPTGGVRLLPHPPRLGLTCSSVL